MSPRNKKIREEILKEGKLNQVIIRETKRPNGTIRIQQDFEFCPTMAEQHTGHLTDINFLMEKYKPDELAQYIAARSSYRQEILDHDFSREPSLQDARNVVAESRRAFFDLPDDIKTQFRSHVEFLKFIDNPSNAEKLLRLGLISKTQLDKLKVEDKNTAAATQTTTTTQEAKE